MDFHTLRKDSDMFGFCSATALGIALSLYPSNVPGQDASSIPAPPPYANVTNQGAGSPPANPAPTDNGAWFHQGSWCQEEEHHGGWSAGAGFLLMKPYFASNPAYSTRTGIATASPQETTTDFSWIYEPAMAFWLGWSSECGLGIRARYFSFQQDSNTFNTSLNSAQGTTMAILPPSSLSNLAGSKGNFASPGIILGFGFGQDLLTFGSSLDISAVDVEATWDLSSCHWGLQLAGGARYLFMGQSYQGVLVNHFANASETQFLSSAHSFNGAGPTAAFQGTYHVGHTGLALFGNVRGSLLLGTARQSASFNQVVTDPNKLVGGSQMLNPNTFSSRDTIMPVAEVEVGLQYSRTVGRCAPFFRASALNQTYFDAGNASQSTGNLSLFGVQFSLGVNY